jgi:hypothetical protein
MMPSAPCTNTWDTMETAWKVPNHDAGDTRSNFHGTEIVLSLPRDYHHSKERAEKLRAALCAVCSPFADAENGLPTTLPPLFQDGRVKDGPENLKLDKTVLESLRRRKEQPVVVSYNHSQLFTTEEDRMVNLEVALKQARVIHLFSIMNELVLFIEVLG